MRLVSTPRIEFLRVIAAEIGHNYPRGRVVVGIDGAPGSGTAFFADGLADVFREAGRAAVRASMRDFHAPRAVRRRDESGAGYYRDSYDYVTLRRALIDPFRLGGSTGFQTAAFDLARDAPVTSSWTTGPADLVLLVDGEFLLRPAIAGVWNATVFLDVDAVTRYRRLAAPEGRNPDPAAPSNARYVNATELYRAEASPEFAASIAVDNTDEELPLRLYPDTGCACL